MFVSSGRLKVVRKETISLFCIVGYMLAWYADLCISPYTWHAFSLHLYGYQIKAAARNVHYVHSHFHLILIRVLLLKLSFQRWSLKDDSQRDRRNIIPLMFIAVNDIVANDNEGGGTEAFHIQLSIYCCQFEDIFKISNKLCTYIYQDEEGISGEIRFLMFKKGWQVGSRTRVFY